jgi:Domain of unknown function (DUF397)
MHTPWRKSSRSYGNNNCVEAAIVDHAPHVRDSKYPGMGSVPLSNDAWTALLKSVRDGRLDN